MDPQSMQHAPSLMGFLPMLLMSIPMGIVAHVLAKQKGRHVVLWTILGIIPLVNMFCTWYLVGASNLLLEEKIDRILRKLGEA